MSQADKKISLTKAKTWTSNWRSNPKSDTRAFLIPVQDLQGALQEMGNPTNQEACVRVYLGVDYN